MGDIKILIELRARKFKDFLFICYLLFKNIFSMPSFQITRETGKKLCKSPAQI